ncbi:hypothetical protein [Coleofasciculus sp.]|uniref:hypothetical protein n=1 Tax=Coleofasciculus sp. TaxID=3100458 RepID=UPI0040639668
MFLSIGDRGLGLGKLGLVQVDTLSVIFMIEALNPPRQLPVLLLRLVGNAHPTVYPGFLT